MPKSKLPHPYSWYYKSFAIDCKCPFCDSDQIYCSRDNDVVFCRHYQCYVSVYECESQMGEDAAGGCKACMYEPSIFCPIEKTSIPTIDCREKHNRFCEKCESVEIMLPSQAELTSDLIYVCDSCDVGVDFAKLKKFEKYES